MTGQKSTQSERRRSPIHTTIGLSLQVSALTVADLRNFVAHFDHLDGSHPAYLHYEGDHGDLIGIEVVI